jgi:hypothetical protein
VHEREQESRVNPAGNERLTAAVGLRVLVPVLVEIASVLLGVHTFMSLHVFVGLALIPAVLLKLGSTGWRFLRYYTRNRAYVAGGPPQIAMRLLAPLFIAATLVLFGSGVAMGRPAGVPARDRAASPRAGVRDLADPPRPPRARVPRPGLEADSRRVRAEG